MRKFFSLALLGVLLVSVSNVLIAGEFTACEDDKENYQALGVYGICNAWHSAETVGDREKFETKFIDKAGFPPPWLAQASCPCFVGDRLEYPDLASSPISDPSSCDQTASTSIARYVPDIQNLQYVAGGTYCVFVNYTGAGPASITPQSFLSPEVAQACRDEVDALILEDFGDIDCS